jgi:hypothetical protein
MDRKGSRVARALLAALTLLTIAACQPLPGSGGKSPYDIGPEQVQEGDRVFVFVAVMYDARGVPAAEKIEMDLDITTPSGDQLYGGKLPMNDTSLPPWVFSVAFSKRVTGTISVTFRVNPFISQNDPNEAFTETLPKGFKLGCEVHYNSERGPIVHPLTGHTQNFITATKAPIARAEVNCNFTVAL